MSAYFNEKFKNLRKARNLTQEQIADVFHVSPQAVSRWETGATFPDIALLPHIAIFFKITVDELLGTEAIRGEQDVENYTRDIRNFLNSGQVHDAIESAQKATKKYPLNSGLHYLLAQALGTKNEVAHKDEIIAISERIIDLTDYKSSLRHRVQLIRHYAKWGMKEEAKKILDTLPSEIWDTKEPWAGLVLDGDDWLKNQINSIIRATMLLDYLLGGYAHMGSLSPLKKIEILKSQLQISSLICTVIDDNTIFPVNYLELALRNILIAELYCEAQDTENALSHVEIATQNSMHHTDHMDKTREDGSNYMPWSTPRNLPWILWEDYLTKPSFDIVRNDKRFLECLELLKANSWALKK
ncbi:MAG: helix-turn-helix domain-containing protein [Defluviitaleaceae bacterium]|nr:helix-turn-helix domain-containing protein [Defluviitaleaceae bacterium]